MVDLYKLFLNKVIIIMHIYTSKNNNNNNAYIYIYLRRIKMNLDVMFGRVYKTYFAGVIINNHTSIILE